MLSCSMLMCSMLMCSMLMCSMLTCSMLTCSMLTCSMLTRSMLPPARCAEPPLTGPCRASFTRWFYDPLNRKCSRFTYGGCEGGGNNFEEDDKCSATCKGVTGTACTYTVYTATCRGGHMYCMYLYCLYCHLQGGSHVLPPAGGSQVLHVLILFILPPAGCHRYCYFLFVIVTSCL